MVEQPFQRKIESQRHYIFAAPFWIKINEKYQLVTFNTGSGHLVEEHLSTEAMEESSEIFRLEDTSSNTPYYIYRSVTGDMFFINTKHTENLEAITLPITVSEDKSNSMLNIRHLSNNNRTDKIGDMLKVWIETYPKDFN